METPPANYIGQQWKRSWLRRLFTWRALKKLLFALICFITVVALIGIEENWRGKRAWTRYANEIKSRAGPVYLTDVAPAPVPDAQNFAAMPLLRSIFPSSPGGSPNSGEDWWEPDFERAALQEGKIRKAPSARKEGERWQPVDLLRWDYAFRNVKLGEKNQDLELPPVTDPVSRSNAAVAVLRWLEPYASSIREFDEASPRPDSRYDIDYQRENPMAILLPHLAVIKRTCSLLKVKAAAELALGQSEAAAKDLFLILKFSDSLKTEPFLISYLVRAACFHVAVRTLWEGLASGQWTDSQLGTFRERFGQPNFIDDLKVAFRGERALANGTFDFLRRSGGRASDIEDFGGDGTAVFRALPRGWLYFEQVNYNRFFEQYILADPNTSEPRIDLRSAIQDDREWEKILGPSGFSAIWKHRVMARLLLPAIVKSRENAARVQGYAEMGALACALELYRRAQGAHPPNLSALVPQFIAKIPQDPVGHEPYRYTLNADGSYCLYSIGWNLQDDSCLIGKTIKDGDWVWRY